MEQAQQRIRDESAADFTAASTSIKKYELAKKLIQSASQSDLEPAPRFALLSLARDLATEANQPGSAIEAAELLTKWFEGDAIATRLRTLEQLKPANAVAAKAIAQAGLTLFDEAIRANQAEAAKRIGQLTLAAAQKSQSAGPRQAGARTSCQGGCEKMTTPCRYSIFSRTPVNSSSLTSRGLPLMLFPRELLTIAGICSARTPISLSRCGIPITRQICSIRSINASAASVS